MPSNKDQCPKCDGLKDTRAKMCKSCLFKYNHPRLGTGAEKVYMQNGYISIRANRKMVYEHRYVMEQHLGRKLKRKEHIHHIDGDKHNNKIENLELVECSEHHRIHIEERKYDMSKKGHKARWGYEYASSL